MIVEKNLDIIGKYYSAIEDISGTVISVARDRRALKKRIDEENPDFIITRSRILFATRYECLNVESRQMMKNSKLNGNAWIGRLSEIEGTKVYF